MPQRGNGGGGVSVRHGARACCSGSQGLPRGGWGSASQGGWGLPRWVERGQTRRESRPAPQRGIGACPTETPGTGRDGDPTPQEGWGPAPQGHPALDGNWVISAPPGRGERGPGGQVGAHSLPAAPEVSARHEQPCFGPGPTMGTGGGQNLGSGTVPPSSPLPNAGPGSHRASVGAGP